MPGRSSHHSASPTPEPRRSRSPGEHYFSSNPSSAPDRRDLTVVLAGRPVRVTTAVGVFSHDRLDRGTAVLLRTVPDPPRTGALLDLGCGWGPLALTMGLLAPHASVWAIDSNPRAVDLVRGNAAALGLPGVRACSPEELPAELRFAAIWSNPPIRIGKPALHALLTTYLPRLLPGADAHLVVQRHLGADSLQAWLTGSLGTPFHVNRVASAKGYRVIRVRRDAGTTLSSPA